MMMVMIVNRLPHKIRKLLYVISLVFQDQHVITLQKLLQDFLESNMSESSEDNESNTSNQVIFLSCITLTC